ncbi:hypothetical protein [Metallosphaera javensis (ex Hofmann et al. 2022)]|uniref:hypothetical protein n=1 Tax=Metallosphaera javensis (ex Hofmann et al. 2022) TaxID=99938 RepID=UPI001EE0C2DB|nr:hypothetical protein [Metallosphaera javensis (ex Hofmann et al. 2022)]BCS91395.1 MAG: hypothetical protein MjAS7_0003 [Metallosphaera javensis (ex Sakai et al. 2022)]
MSEKKIKTMDGVRKPFNTDLLDREKLLPDLGLEITLKISTDRIERISEGIEGPYTPKKVRGIREYMSLPSPFILYL